MTTKKPGIMLIVAFISFLGLGQTASAAPCQGLIDDLRTALNDGYCSYGKYKRCKRLNRKLDRVARKLEKGKFRKAARKLSNFGRVIENMAMRRKPRMAMADFKGMAVPYTQVSECIASGGVVAEAPAPEPMPDPTPTPQPDWDLNNE